MTATTYEPTRELTGLTWRLDPSHTSVQFAVKHLVIATVRGRFGDVSGSLHLAHAKPYESEVRIAIATASVETGDEKRDAHLRSADFFNAERNPTITFTGGRISGDIRGRFELSGHLTINGITRPVVLKVKNEGRVTDPWGRQKLAVSATAKVNRLDYGLKWNVALETGGVLVGDEVSITIEAQFAAE
jgi:polyisoprenoid-binding protein YceI